MSEPAQMQKGELRLVRTHRVDADIREEEERIKKELVLAIAPVLNRYGMTLAKTSHQVLSDEFSMTFRASVPDGLQQDCITRDLLSYAHQFGYNPALLGRTINRKNPDSQTKDCFVISGLDVVDKEKPSNCKFRVFNRENPDEVMLVDFDVVKKTFPSMFK